MKTRSIYLSGLALLVVVVIGYIAQRQRLPKVTAGNTVQDSAGNLAGQGRIDDHRDVVLRVSAQHPTNAVTPGLTKFEILNNGSSPLMCPDSWSVVFEDGRLQELSLPKTGNIRVQPGGKGAITITNPVATGAWRLVANYYFEDIVFDVKVKIDQSALKNALPLSVRGVRGQDVMSDWIK